MATCKRRVVDYIYTDVYAINSTRPPPPFLLLFCYKFKTILLTAVSSTPTCLLEIKLKRSNLLFFSFLFVFSRWQTNPNINFFRSNWRWLASDIYWSKNTQSLKFEAGITNWIVNAARRRRDVRLSHNKHTLLSRSPKRSQWPNHSSKIADSWIRRFTQRSSGIRASRRPFFCNDDTHASPTKARNLCENRDHQNHFSPLSSTLTLTLLKYPTQTLTLILVSKFKAFTKIGEKFILSRTWIFLVVLVVFDHLSSYRTLVLTV